MTKEDCEAMRREIKAVAEKAWTLSMRQGMEESQPSEAYSNVVLAYRHLEDASMRLGKAIQALDGGTSVYDRSQTPGA